MSRPRAERSPDGKGRNHAVMALVCPIAQGGNFARHAGFAVPLSGAGTETQGVVLCNQLRVLDRQARKAQFIETLPDFIMDEILAKLLPLFE
jgi:mRNA interferase ChpB